MNHTARVEALRAKMAKEKLPALLISQPENRRYLSGYTAEDGALTESSGHLLITEQEAFLLTDFRFKEEAAEEAPDFETKIYTKGLVELLTQLLGEMKVEKLGFEADFLTYNTVQAMTKVLYQAKVKVAPTTGLTAKLRLIKEPEEVEEVKAALALIESVMNDLFESIVPGMTEQEGAWKVYSALKAAGSEPAFEPIVAAGENGAKPHAVPTDRKIRERETIVIDIGARINGYRSDITRTMWLGEPTAKFKEVYSTVRAAQLAAINGILPGMSTIEADSLARKVIEEAGYGEFFGHSLGHGVGLATHEDPPVGPVREAKLLPGIIHTIEPGIYLPGWGGVRLEVMGLITEEKVEVLGELDRFYKF